MMLTAFEGVPTFKRGEFEALDRGWIAVRKARKDVRKDAEQRTTAVRDRNICNIEQAYVAQIRGLSNGKRSGIAATTKRRGGCTR